MTTLKIRLVLLAIILFIASCVKSCTEVRYVCFGKTTTATKVQGQEREGDTLVDYEYADAGTARSGVDRMDSGWKPSGPVLIQYIPGSNEDSRLAGHPQWWWLVPPVGFLGFIGFHTWKFWKFYKS